MTNNNNTNKENTMIKETNTTKENKMSYYPQTVASQMDKGLTTESDKITEIANVLRKLGNSRREVSYYLNVDEDFISDVLSCYKEKKMSIQVGDKVKWSLSFQALNQQCLGHVVSTHMKVMGNPCFLIQECGDTRQTMVSKDKVSKAS